MITIMDVKAQALAQRKRYNPLLRKSQNTADPTTKPTAIRRTGDIYHVPRNRPTVGIVLMID
jgi:hypothetical protein